MMTSMFIQSETCPSFDIRGGAVFLLIEDQSNLQIFIHRLNNSVSR